MEWNGSDGGTNRSQEAGTLGSRGSHMGDGRTDGVLTPSEELRT